MLADVSGRLLMSAKDVRGEIVFYLRHRADKHIDTAKRVKTVGKKLDAAARAAELQIIADQLEAAEIVLEVES